MGFKRVLNSRMAAVGAGATVLAVLAGGAGYAAGQIDSGDIKNGSVRSVDIKDGDLRAKDLHKSVLKGTASDADVKKLANAILAQNGVIEDLQGQVDDLSDQVDSLPGTDARSFTSTGPTTIDIGGSFAQRATVLGTLELPAGEYLINGFGFFDTVAANSPRTDSSRLMLALRGPTSTGDAFGTDYGTCFTGSFAPAPVDRESTCTTSRTITLTETTTIRVLAFGYNDDGSGTDDSFTAFADVSALKVG